MNAIKTYLVKHTQATITTNESVLDVANTVLAYTRDDVLKTLLAEYDQRQRNAESVKKATKIRNLCQRYNSPTPIDAIITIAYYIDEANEDAAFIEDARKIATLAGIDIADEISSGYHPNCVCVQLRKLI
jgi:hypothetical protein